MGEFGELLSSLGGEIGILGALVILALGIFSWKVLGWWREDTKEANAAVMKMQADTLAGMNAATDVAKETQRLVNDLAREVRDARPR